MNFNNEIAKRFINEIGIYSFCIDNKSVHEKIAYINVICMSKEHIDGQTQEKHELDKTHELLLVLYEIRLSYAL